MLKTQRSKMSRTYRLKINFVSHLNPLHYSGGGEQITRAIIEEGSKRGHVIRIVSMKPKKWRFISQLRIHSKPDLWLLFDIFNCPEQKQHFRKSFINKIISSEKYILGQNAYGELCYLNELPCNGEIGDGSFCVEKKEDYYGVRGNKSGWKDGYCPVNDNRELFKKALLNIFLSPLHASVFQKIYPAIKPKTYILKPLIDVDGFTNESSERDIEYASYGGMSEAKGFYNIRERFPEKEIVFFGSSGHLAEKYKYGKVIGRIPYEKMPDFLNRVKYYIHMPRWPEPHGLIINQAVLSGCKLITNENVGALTHDFEIADRSAYKNNAAELWNMLEETVSTAKGDH